MSPSTRSLKSLPFWEFSQRPLLGALVNIVNLNFTIAAGKGTQRIQKIAKAHSRINIFGRIFFVIALEFQGGDDELG